MWKLNKRKKELKHVLEWRWDVWLKPQLLDRGEPRAQEWRQGASDGSTMDWAYLNTPALRPPRKLRHKQCCSDQRNSWSVFWIFNNNLHSKQCKKGNTWRWNHVSWAIIFQYYFKNKTVFMLQQDNGSGVADSFCLRWTHLMHDPNVHFSFDSGKPNGPAREG